MHWQPLFSAKVYKFLERKHAESMVNEGLIQISPLKAFKNTEIHGNQIGDAGEGTAKFISEVDFATGDQLDPVAKSIIRARSDSTFENCGFIKTVLTPENISIFCMSLTSSEDVMRKMNPKYDTCVEIYGLEFFFSAIRRHLKKNYKINDIACSNCFYRGRSFVYSKKMPHHFFIKKGEFSVDAGDLVFHKEKEYEYQKEVRIAFSVPESIREEFLKPKVIKVSDITKFCRILNSKKAAA